MEITDNTNDLILFDSILTAETEQRRNVQTALLKELIYRNGNTLTFDEIDSILESAGSHFVSRKTAIRLMSDLKIAEVTDIGVRLDRSLQLVHISSDFLPEGLMTPVNRISQIWRALQTGLHWCIEIALKASESGSIRRGLPAFLDCDGITDNFIGYEVAATATSDALSILCERYAYIADVDKQNADLAIDYLLLSTLSCQAINDGKTDSWDYGGFFPYDDQPGAMHPTIEATCLAIISLASCFLEGFCVENKEVILEAIERGCGFIEKMLSRNGRYSSYSYEFENLNVLAEPNENCVRLIITALGISKPCLNNDSYTASCNKAIAKAYEYLLEKVIIDGDGASWVPTLNTVRESIPYHEEVVSTARILRTVGQLKQVDLELWEKYKEIIQSANFDFERINHSAVDTYKFKVPGKLKLEGGYHSWISYADTWAASMLLSLYLSDDINLDINKWAFIDSTIDFTLQRQDSSHGHWNNPENNNPFIPCTLNALQILELYLSSILKYQNDLK